MKRAHGIALIETLIAAPIVLWLGLAALQWGLVFHARSAVVYALNEAARAGSVNGADPQAVESGLARGLAPFLYGASDEAGQLAAVLRAQAHVASGKDAGWLLMRQLSPTEQSFADWAEPDVDAFGEPVLSRRVIPNDNLAYRMRASRPASGVSGWRGAEAIGQASGQTLADANLLKLELVYGVPMNVPFVAPLAAWALRAIDGCAVAQPRTVGLADLGTPAAGAARGWTCAFYDAIDEQGRRTPRVPVKLSTTIRMQSPARQANGARRERLVLSPSSGGQRELDDLAAPIAAAGGSPTGSQTPQTGEDGGSNDSSSSRPQGFLHFGGQRDALALGACTGG